MKPSKAQLYILPLACSLAVLTQVPAFAEEVAAPVAPVAEAQEEVVGHVSAPANPVTEVAPTQRIADPNPSYGTYHGWGRFRFPLTVKVDVGTNVSVDSIVKNINPAISSFSSILGSLQSGKVNTADTTNVQNALKSTLAPLQSGLRLDYDIDTTLVSFSGNPIEALKIADRKVSIGASLTAGSRGYTTASVSKEFADGLTGLSGAIPDVVAAGSTLAGISGQTSTLATEVSNLTSSIAKLSTSASSVLSNPTAILTNPSSLNELNTQANNVITSIDNLAVPANKVVSSANAAITTAEKVLSSLKSLNGSVKVDTVNDLHLTLGLAGAYPVYENKENGIKVSVGTNLKVFILPTNIPVKSLAPTINTTAGIFGQIKVDQVSGFSDVSSMQATIDKVKDAASKTNSVVQQANSVKTSLTTLQGQLSQAQSGNTSAITALQTTGAATLAQATQAQTAVNDATTALNSAFSSINTLQSSFIQDLSKVSVSGTVLTPGGAGFGLDLGVQATLFHNLNLGLLLQNPVVLWPGSQRPVSLGFAATADGKGITPKFTVDDTKMISANYNQSEPFAALLSANYSFDQVMKDFPGLSVNGSFEYVGNGRQPALNLGVQKQFGVAYAGLGGRVGGISPLVYLQGGLRTAGNYGLDLSLGFVPTGTGIPAPGMGWLGLVNLGMYLQY